MDMPQKLDAPGYPSVAGQSQPDLNLAGLNPPAVEHMPPIIQSMATPPQNLGVPALSTNDPIQDLMMLGIDPTLPFEPLNLAGSNEPVPSPARLAMPADHSSVNAPTFSEPHFEVPPLQKDFDLHSPGIDLEQDVRNPNVDLPQLNDPIHPRGLFMLDHLAMRDPTLPMQPPDQPSGLTSMERDMWAPDPMQPDLQHPDLSQEVEVSDHPGDLAEDAMRTMHDAPTYEQLPTHAYDELYMVQQGNNATRERHQGLLMLGLDREEGVSR
jgi:hypothetical protein